MSAETSQNQSRIIEQAPDPLAQLRDIHQPNMIESWPPAPGWWLLATLALVMLITLVSRVFRYWRGNRYRREAIKEMNELLNDWRYHKDDRLYLTSLQGLLKRVALTAFPRDDVASLTGEAWVQFLDRSSNSRDFSVGEMELLIDGNYKPNIVANVESIQSLASQWVKRHQTRFIEQTPE